MNFKAFSFLLLIWCMNVLASEAVGANDKKHLYDTMHDKFSKGFLDISRRIDRFFSGQRADDFINSSQIRLISVTTKSENPGLFTEGRMRLNLILPGTQDKFQLIIEGQGDTQVQNSGQQSNITQDNDATSSVTNVQNTTTAAFRYMTSVLNINTSFDSGIRVNIPPSLFARARFWRQDQLNKDWIFRPRQEIFWMDSEGLQSTLNLDFDRPLENKDFLFRFVNKAFWNDQDYLIEYTNGPSLYQNLNDISGLSYHFNIITNQSEITEVVNYLTRVSYRRLLYKNWFFGEISPQLEFPKEFNFHRTPSIAFKLELVMGAI